MQEVFRKIPFALVFVLNNVFAFDLDLWLDLDLALNNVFAFDLAFWFVLDLALNNVFALDLAFALDLPPLTK